jgi:hypothetical protein
VGEAGAAGWRGGRPLAGGRRNTSVGCACAVSRRSGTPGCVGAGSCGTLRLAGSSCGCVCGGRAADVPVLWRAGWPRRGSNSGCSICLVARARIFIRRSAAIGALPCCRSAAAAAAAAAAAVGTSAAGWRALLLLLPLQGGLGLRDGALPADVLRGELQGGRFRSFQQPPPLRQVGLALLQGGLPGRQLSRRALQPLLVVLSCKTLDSSAFSGLQKMMARPILPCQLLQCTTALRQDFHRRGLYALPCGRAPNSDLDHG